MLEIPLVREKWLPSMEPSGMNCSRWVGCCYSAHRIAYGIKRSREMLQRSDPHTTAAVERGSASKIKM